MQKIGINERTAVPDKMEVSFVIIDNKPHLNEQGITYLCKWTKQLVLVTTNKEHPAFQLKIDNLHIIYQDRLNLKQMLEVLAGEYHVERITLQSGGTLNEQFLRNKFLDFVDIVVAPILIGGKDTSTLIDGRSLIDTQELGLLSALKLEKCTVLEDSYVRLTYKVIR